MRRGARRIVTLVWVLAGIYVAIAGLVFLLQERLIFPGAWMDRGEAPALPGLRYERLHLDGGGHARVAIAVPEQPHAVMVFFVGNGEALPSCAARAADLAQLGVAAVVPEYPGYGESSGAPGVETFLRTAEAAAAHAQRLAAQLERPYLVGGISIGSFSATHVAARTEPAKCLLLSPPTSLVEAAKQHYAWLPIALLLRHRFDNMRVAADVACPTLVVHGERDGIVPVAHGRRVAAALPRAELIVVPHRGHDLGVVDAGAASARIAAFLRDP